MNKVRHMTVYTLSEKGIIAFNQQVADLKTGGFLMDINSITITCPFSVNCTVVGLAPSRA